MRVNEILTLLVLTLPFLMASCGKKAEESTPSVNRTCRPSLAAWDGDGNLYARTTLPLLRTVCHQRPQNLSSGSAERTLSRLGSHGQPRQESLSSRGNSRARRG